MRLSFLRCIGLLGLAFAPVACGARLIGETDPFDSSGSAGGAGGGSGNGGGTTTTGTQATTATGTSTGVTTGTGGAPVQCNSDAACSFLNGPCVLGACLNGTCSQVPFNEGGPCDDGKSCTSGDSCQKGGCFGFPSCPSPDPCLVGQCGSSGQCSYLPANVGACEDGDPCTIGDSCFEGKCFPGMFMDCSVWNTQCTQGVCTPNGCQPAEINEGQPCNDGQFCSAGETCQGGACYGGGVLDCTGGLKCVIGTCNELSDTCSVSPAPNGSGCDDGSACTVGDSCQAGVCIGSGPTVFFADDFSDASVGWTLGPEWQIGPAQMSAGGVFGFDPPVDHTATNDNGIAGVVIGGNANINFLHLPYFIESPPFDTSGAPSVVLSYWRWLNSDYDPYMHNYVQVFTGAGWVTVWMSGNIGIEDTPPNGQGWTFITHDITALKNANMRVRFGFDITSQGVYTIGSWNLDDVTVAETPCP